MANIIKSPIGSKKSKKPKKPREPMSAEKKRKLRRGATVAATVLLIGAASVGGYFWLQGYNQKVAERKQAEEAEAKAVFEGTYADTGTDQSRKVDYAKFVNEGKLDRAADVYKNAISTAESEEDEYLLRREYLRIATVAGQNEHSVEAAVGLADMRPSLENLDSAALAYRRVGDVKNEAKYLRLQYDLVDGAEGFESIQESIRSQLESMGEGI